MLKNNSSSQSSPERIVIVGAGGFVGKAVTKKLLAQGLNVVPLSHQDLDLLSQNAVEKLALILRKTDTLIMIAAQAPVKNNTMLIDNLRMMAAVCEALKSIPVAHTLYVSSDAVYADSGKPLSETSRAQPNSLHGIMHLARETMLASAYQGPLCILRPTLIYGAGDPHNGYGPNRFRRLAHRGEDIVLFGEGEERRDHVFIDDVAEIAARCVTRQHAGVLNVATGRVASFREIAEQVVALAPKSVPIKASPRTGTMPHNGYRPFDATLTTQLFPGFTYTPLEKGLALSQQQEFHHG